MFVYRCLIPFWDITILYSRNVENYSLSVYLASSIDKLSNLDTQLISENKLMANVPQEIGPLRNVSMIDQY